MILLIIFHTDIYHHDITATKKRTQPNYAEDIQKNDARVYLMQVNQIPVKCIVIAALTLCVLLMCFVDLPVNDGCHFQLISECYFHVAIVFLCGSCVVP